LAASDDICIRMKALGKSFQEKQKTVEALRGLDLEVRRGEFLCLVGPSGCGKTTLLRCLAGIEKPTSGELEIHTEKRPDSTPLAMVFQQHGLFPWMTIERNMRFVLEASAIDPKLHAEIVERFLERVGLLRFKRFYPHQLSGGMNQRISLVRAFCVYPQVLLMDEPFVFLDYQNRISLQDLLLRLWEESRQTIVFVTHNINEALTLGDRVVVMTSAPGRFKRELLCEFPRPRDVMELRKDPEYGRMVVDISNDLRAEIESAEKQIEESCLLSRVKARD